MKWPREARPRTVESLRRQWTVDSREGVSVVLFAAFLTLAAQSPAPTSLKEVSEDLVCQCGCNTVLYNCGMHNCGSATPMREEIETKIAGGANKEAILASFVERVGLKVLAAPPAEGFNLAAWVLPIVVLVAGGVVALRVLQSWRAKAATAPSAAAPVAFPTASTISPMSEEQRRRIESELQDFES